MPHKRSYSAYAAENADAPSGAFDVLPAAGPTSPQTHNRTQRESMLRSFTRRLRGALARSMRFLALGQPQPQRLESSPKRRAMEAAPPSSQVVATIPQPPLWRRAYASIFTSRNATNTAPTTQESRSRLRALAKQENALTRMQKSAQEVQKSLFSESRRQIGAQRRERAWGSRAPGLTSRSVSEEELPITPVTDEEPEKFQLHQYSLPKVASKPPATHTKRPTRWAPYSSKPASTPSYKLAPKHASEFAKQPIKRISSRTEKASKDTWDLSALDKAIHTKAVALQNDTEAGRASDLRTAELRSLSPEQKATRLQQFRAERQRRLRLSPPASASEPRLQVSGIENNIEQVKEDERSSTQLAELRSQAKSTTAVEVRTIASREEEEISTQPAEHCSLSTTEILPAAINFTRESVSVQPATELRSQVTSAAIPETPSAHRYRLRSRSPTKVANDHDAVAPATAKLISDGAFLTKVFENVVAPEVVKREEITVLKKQMRKSRYLKKASDDVVFMEMEQGKRQKLETPEKKVQEVFEIARQTSKEQEAVLAHADSIDQAPQAVRQVPQKVQEIVKEVHETVPEAMEGMEATQVVQIVDTQGKSMTLAEASDHETAPAAGAAVDLPDYEDLPDVQMADGSPAYFHPHVSLFPISPSYLMPPPPSRRPFIPQLQITIPQDSEPQEMEGVVATPTSITSTPTQSQTQVMQSPSKNVFIPIPASISFMPSKSKEEIMQSWVAKQQPQTPVNVGFMPSKSKEQILQSWAKKEMHTHPMQTRSMAQSQVAGGGNGDELQLSLDQLSIQPGVKSATATEAMEQGEPQPLPSEVQPQLSKEAKPLPASQVQQQAQQPTQQHFKQPEPPTSRPVSRDSQISGIFMLSPRTGSARYPFGPPRSNSIDSNDWEHDLTTSVLRQAKFKLEEEVKEQRRKSFAETATNWIKDTRTLLLEQQQAELFGQTQAARGYNTKHDEKNTDDESTDDDEPGKKKSKKSLRRAERLQDATAIDDEEHDDIESMANKTDAEDGLEDAVKLLEVKDQEFDDSVAELISDSKAIVAEKEAARRASQDAEVKAAAEAAAQRLAARIALKMDEVIPPAWVEKFEDIVLHGTRANEIPQPLSAHDLRSLRPRTWLNDAVVNEYLKHVCEAGNTQRGWKKGTFPPPLVPYMSQWYTTCRERGVESTKGWSRRHRWKDGLLLNVEAVLFPINQRSHWTLLIVYPGKRQIEYLDSFGACDRDVVRTAVDWLKMELGDKFKPEEWDLEGGTGVLVSGKSAEQTNGYDCGAFVCFNALARVKGVEPALGLHQDDLIRGRVRLGATLLNGGFKAEFEW